MLKEDVLKKLTDCGLVAVVRANNAEEAIKISDACLAGGCTGIELTFTVPGADKVIAALAEKYSNGEMMLGAGTVLDPETARMAILAGANFIVSPAFNADFALPQVMCFASTCLCPIFKNSPKNILSPMFP